MGDKSQAKAIMKGPRPSDSRQRRVANEDHLAALAKQVGYPLMIKAVAGSGKGRIIHSEDELLKGPPCRAKLGQHRQTRSMGNTSPTLGMRFSWGITEM